MKPFRLFHVMAITVWIIQQYFVYASVIGIVVIVEMVSSIILKYQVVQFNINNFN